MTRRRTTRSAAANAPPYLSLSLAALLVSAFPGCSALPRLEGMPALAPGGDELAVLTYNVFGFPLLEDWQRPARFGVIKDELRSSLADVDVVLLQEAFISTTGVLRQARRHSFDGACGGGEGFNPTGLVLLSDHAPLGRAASFAFVQDAGGEWRMQPEAALDCGALSERRRPLKGMMALTLTTPRGPVDIVNVHLGTDPGARHAQKRLVARYLEERASSRPLIVAGDLNEETCDSGGGPFPGSVSLDDASCGVGPTVGGVRLGMIQGALFPAEIDSVYVCGAAPTDKRARLFSSPRAGGHLSDHDAVLAAVRIDDEGSPRYGCRP